MPEDWDKAFLNLPLFGESELGYDYAWADGVVTLVLYPGEERKFEISLARKNLQPVSVTIDGKKADLQRARWKGVNLCEIRLTATAATTIRVTWENS